MTVINLSDVFGDEENETNKFVARYLKTTHCDILFADALILVEGIAENYRTFPIRQTLCDDLSWSHYNLLMRIEDEKSRHLFLK